MKKKFFKIIFSVFGIIFLYIAFDFISFCIKDDAQNRPCEQYNLSQYAKTCDDLLITHEATGIIDSKTILKGQYVVKVNQELWENTTAEQRLLILCAAKEVAKNKGLKSLVIDNNGNEY